MLVVVRLITSDRGNYYSPVDNVSFGTLMAFTGYGWFHQSQWERVRKQLSKVGYKISNRWYHIRRRKDLDPNLVHLASGQSVYEY